MGSSPLISCRFSPDGKYVFASAEDRTIQRYAARRDAILAELKADDTLADLHEQAVAWRRERFETLMKQEPFRALFGRLLMTPPTRPVPPKAAQFMIQFANRARQSAQ